MGVARARLGQVACESFLCCALGERVSCDEREIELHSREKKDGNLETLSANTRLGLMAAHWCQGR